MGRKGHWPLSSGDFSFSAEPGTEKLWGAGGSSRALLELTLPKKFGRLC